MLGVGAIVVAAWVAYVSYNALNGLPFQSSYHINVELPDAERLIATDDVRIGGVRVGQVTSVAATPGYGGQPPYAMASLAINPSVGQLPRDTTVSIRAASALGATYVQLTLGRSDQTIRSGGTLPLKQASTTVSVTDLFQIFDGSSARNFQRATDGLAAGLAGRGANVNSAIGSISALLPDATNVASALASPKARLSAFLNAFSSTSTTIGHEANSLAGLVAGGSTTFGAIAAQRPSLGAAIDALPTTESATQQAFVTVTPALGHLAELTTDLQPGARLLPGALTTINHTLSAGVKPLRQLPTLTEPLRHTFTALTTVSGIRSTDGALRKLKDLMGALEQTLVALTPAQVHCNIVGLLGENISSTFGLAGTGDGPSYAVFGLATSGDTTDEIQSKVPAPNAHFNNLPTENATECQSNNEPYNIHTQDLSPPTSLQPDHARATYPPPGVLQRAAAAHLLAAWPPHQ